MDIMTRVQGTRKLLSIGFLPVFCLLCSLNTENRASASLVQYKIADTFSTSGFSASWLHAATGALNKIDGTEENGARRSGKLSSRISGSLEGDLNGTILSDISGNVTGMLKQLSGYLNTALGTSFGMNDTFDLKLGKQSRPGDAGMGAMQFETSGPGEYTGGFLDFDLVVEGVSALTGTFFFKPQAESGNAALSPNRGTSSEFTLWGANWMHDAGPVDGGAEADWGTFLTSLGYTGGDVLRTALDSGNNGEGDATIIAASLGIDLYVSIVPEAASVMTWLMLSGLGCAYACRQRRAI